MKTPPFFSRKAISIKISTHITRAIKIILDLDSIGSITYIFIFSLGAQALRGIWYSYRVLTRRADGLDLIQIVCVARAQIPTNRSKAAAISKPAIGAHPYARLPKGRPRSWSIPRLFCALGAGTEGVVPRKCYLSPGRPDFPGWVVCLGPDTVAARGWSRPRRPSQDPG